MTAEDAAEIRRRLDGMVDCYNNNNMYEAAKYFLVDCTCMAPGKPTFVGREGQAASFRRSFEILGVTKLLWKVDLFHHLDDEVALTSYFWHNINDDGVDLCNGKGCFMWRKVRGEWMIAVEVWNCNPDDK